MYILNDINFSKIFYQLVKDRDIKSIKYFVEAGYDPNFYFRSEEMDGQGHSLYHYIAQHGTLEDIEWLQTNSQELGITLLNELWINNYGESPLSNAISAQNFDIVKWFVDNFDHNQLNLRSEDHYTSLQEAAVSGNIEIFKLILSISTDYINVIDNAMLDYGDYTVLDIIVQDSSTELLAKLLPEITDVRIIYRAINIARNTLIPDLTDAVDIENVNQMIVKLEDHLREYNIPTMYDLKWIDEFEQEYDSSRLKNTSDNLGCEYPQENINIELPWLIYQFVKDRNERVLGYFLEDYYFDFDREYVVYKEKYLPEYGYGEAEVDSEDIILSVEEYIENNSDEENLMLLNVIRDKFIDSVLGKRSAEDNSNVESNKIARTDSSSDNPNDRIVQHAAISSYENPALNNPYIETLAVRAAEQVSEKNLDELFELLKDQDVVDGLAEAVKEKGSAHVLKTLFDKVEDSSQNDEVLAAKAKLEEIIGIDNLGQLEGYSSYIFNALSSFSNSQFARDVVQKVSALASSLDYLLNLAETLPSLKLENHIAILIAQLENSFDFIASGITHVALPRRYNDFNPGDDFDGGYFGGGDNGYNPKADLEINLSFYGSTNSTMDNVW
jgi:hypothetical protein